MHQAQERYQKPDYTRDYYRAYYNLILNHILVGTESYTTILTMFPGAELYDVTKFLYDVSNYKKGDEAKIAADLMALGFSGAAEFADEVIDVAKMAKKAAVKRVSKLLDPKLVEELAQSGQKFTREALVGIAKNPAGKIVWLEKGNASAGLEHILQRHAKDFVSAGLNSSDEIAEFIIKTVKASDGVKDGGATIFDVVMGGKQRHLKVVISDNGFIVTAYPFSK